jgi:hypothetical protein
VARPAIVPEEHKERLVFHLVFRLLTWIASGGQLRSDDQIVDEMVAALGFSRRGKRIESAIHRAIAYWRPRSLLS